jgi:hypothetical protein
MKKILTISIFTTLLALATLGFSHKAHADYYGSNYSNYNYGGYNNYNYVGGHAAANYAHQFYSTQRNQDNYYQTYYPPAPAPVYYPPAPVTYYNPEQHKMTHVL